MIKNIVIGSSLILMTAFCASGFADEHFPFLAEVSKESVNVRAGPNTNFEKVDKLSKGTKVVVIGRNFEWLKIQPLATTKSYIRSDYLKISAPGDVAEVIGDNVNMRCAPNSESASLGEVKKGTLVKVKTEVKGWSSLEPVSGTAAWIHQDFLKQVSQDVPGSMLIAEVQWPAPVVVAAPVQQTTETVSFQGKFQAMPQTPAADIHYGIVADDKTVYYLQDVPQMSFFANAIVTIEGTVVPDPQKKFIYPVLHINKIALVL